MFPMMSGAAPFVAESTAVDAGHGIDEKLISLSPRCGHQMAATAEHSRKLRDCEIGTHNASNGFQGCYAGFEGVTEQMASTRSNPCENTSCQSLQP